ncbi:MAG: nucleotidyltransferase family protein [Christensenellaceae bacterium]|nr:nucleotidyltransferase family protein [Christensenellaceae bacterium]
MKISAIIAEYNPFHAGHAYHIDQTRKKSGADAIIVIQSGDFTQRGEPALFDKWTRARSALFGGADMVIELPFTYACASAERFALGAVSILNGTGLADTLSFGCEHANSGAIEKLARLFVAEDPAYRQQLKNGLEKGLSFPAARQAAAAALLGEDTARLLALPNSILAVEYQKALMRTGSPMQPLLIRRSGSGYNQMELPESGSYPSAMALRNALKKGLLSPASVGGGSNQPVFPENILPYLRYALRLSSPAKLSGIEGMGEGLENLLWQAGRGCGDYEELLASIKSRRYPRTRLCRLLIACLLGYTAKERAAIDAAGPYIRVLGVRKKSTHLLSLLAEKATLPVITQPQNSPDMHPGLKLELRATDLYDIIRQPAHAAGQDFTKGLLITE